MMFPGLPMDPGWMAWWGFGSLLLWGGLILLGVVAIFRLAQSRTDTSARHVLDERLARGQIDPEEYRSRRALLDG